MEEYVLLISLLSVDLILFSIWINEKNMVLGDTCFVLFCLLAHLLLYASFFAWTKPLRYVVDWMLFAAMGYALFLRSNALLVLSICTMVVIGVYHSIFGKCLLVGEKWGRHTNHLFFALLALQIGKLKYGRICFNLFIP